MGDDRPCRRAGVRGDDRCRGAADDEADERAGEAEHERLGERVQFDLEAACAVPAQAPAGIADVASQSRRRQHGEGEEEHAALAAEQQQAP